MPQPIESIAESEILRDPDSHWMHTAIELAKLGHGHVEPNPMVGCVVVKDSQIVSQGYHPFYGGPHAERVAIPESLDVSDATVYVTLEPCSHHGKTPPCAPYLLAKKPRRVVVAMQDPFPEVSGRGIRLLKEHGIDVTVGVCESQARELNAPYLKRLSTKQPWTIAKWAMSLDGCIATATGDSKWITNAQSRQVVHQFRSTLDAIVIGIGTALADDPSLTCRLVDDSGVDVKPARIATRIVMDQHARLPLTSQLVRTAKEIPVWVVTGPKPNPRNVQQLEAAGVKVLVSSPTEASNNLATNVTLEQKNTYNRSLQSMLVECGRLNFTNIMIEGGAKLLGQAFDQDCIDQIECFIAPKVIGNGLHPVAGQGKQWMRDVESWHLMQSVIRDGDTHLTLRKTPIKSVRAIDLR
ncbi:bifunctional diaminohydroxyphosphoribosylaminopyrimidine deaminase/5-amino-6-(5-phosphoribosylamino)uracil reductase RibD [Pirellulaceae bacterium SH449]